jgi:hypothetical protein
MALRTTADEVKKLVEVDANVSSDLAPFILSASLLVDKVVAVALDDDGAAFYTAEELELIERWLSAHFYTIRDNRIASEGVKSLTASYQYAIGKGLASSMQGQTAMMLDRRGGLAALSKATEQGKGRKVRVVALGCGEIEDC